MNHSATFQKVSHLDRKVPPSSSKRTPWGQTWHHALGPVQHPAAENTPAPSHALSGRPPAAPLQAPSLRPRVPPLGTPSSGSHATLTGGHKSGQRAEYQAEAAWPRPGARTRRPPASPRRMLQVQVPAFTVFQKLLCGLSVDLQILPERRVSCPPAFTRRIGAQRPVANPRGAPPGIGLGEQLPVRGLWNSEQPVNV
nr:uncharacterized protein LOC118970253 isoform X2 [Manis javanica]